jgi:GNAT superfamily N-acetyltransferase
MSNRLSLQERSIQIRTGPVENLAEYARIPSCFSTQTVFDVSPRPPHELRERRLDAVFEKDYDALSDPLLWPKMFDVANWGLLSAHDGNRRVGGAIVAFDTPSVDMLEGRRDLAVLWDIRVEPQSQGRGIGAALFQAACDWAHSHGARELKIETQNVNTAACHFYRAMGCTLAAANFDAYSELPAEVQLLWRTTLPLRSAFKL